MQPFFRITLIVLMLKISLQILLILGAITLCSCNSVLPKSMEVAHQQSDNYYRYLQTNKQDSLLALFSETFYAETDTAALLKAIDQIKNELGEIVFAEYLSDEINISSVSFQSDYLRNRYGTLLWKYGMDKVKAGYVSDTDDPARPKSDYTTQAEGGLVNLE